MKPWEDVGSRESPKDRIQDRAVERYPGKAEEARLVSAKRRLAAARGGVLRHRPVTAG